VSRLEMCNPASMKSRRVKSVVVTPEALLDLLKVRPGGEVVDGIRVQFADDGIPDSATALRAGLDHNGNIHLLVEDESFSEIREGEVVTRLSLLYTHQREPNEIDRAIQVLNRALAASPNSIRFLVENRTVCTESLADDPTIQCAEDEGSWFVGMLGIINGILGVDRNSGYGPIQAMFDAKTGNILRFERSRRCKEENIHHPGVQSQ